MVEKSVLILDENTTSRSFLANHLRGKQFNVFEAGSGKEALIVAWRDEPHLILFDPVISDLSDVEFIQKLRQNSRTANTPIIALSNDPSSARKEACLNAGVNEYLFKSAEAMSALEQSLARFLVTGQSSEKTAEEQKKEDGLLIVFLSAKGGTGTSSLCANIAMNIKRVEPQARIVVADLVLPIGSISQIVGYTGETNIVTVADLPPAQTNRDYFRTNLPTLEAWNFQLLAGSPTPQHANILKGERIEEIVDELRAGYDFVLLDIGRALSRISLPLIQKADVICLIVASDQSTVLLTRTVWDYLQTQGIDSQKIYAIMNRAVGMEGLTRPDAERIIGLDIKTAMPYMGGNVTVANNRNQPLTVKYPTDTASIILKEATEGMVQLARRLRSR